MVEALGSGEPALRQQYLPRMLTDPVRAVRIESARSLAGAGEAAIPTGARAGFDKALVHG